MKCEMCGENYPRRRSRVNGKLVCWMCEWATHMIAEGDPEHLLRQSHSKGWNRVHDLEAELDRRKTTQVQYEKKEYTFSNAVSAVPPKDVLEKALTALDEYRYFTEFAKVLGDYYGVVAPRYLKDTGKKHVPSDANAIYFPTENIVYCPPRKHFKYRTAFHEMWHGLERHGLVPKKQSEKNAEIYARQCLITLGLDVNS